jgi:hypothetical protein
MSAARTVSATFTASSGGGGSGYDIAAKIAEVNTAMGVTVNLPTAPTLTSTCSASNAAEFSACIATNGTDVTVTADFSGDFTIGGADKRITINSGVTISATGNTSLGAARVFNITGTRIHIRGPGTVGGALYTSAAAQDVRLDSRLRIITRTDSADHNWDRWEMLGTRLLAEGIIVRSKTYAPYSAASTDLVVANCDIEEVGAADAAAAQPSFRVVGVTRVVLIDSRIHNPWRHSVRAHSNGSTPSNYVYIARNSIETDADDNLGGGVMSNKSAGNPNPQTTNLWFNENLIYASGVHINDDGDSIAGHGFVEAIDNTVYSNLAGVGFLFGPAAYAGTRTNNVKAAYQGPSWVQQ